MIGVVVNIELIDFINVCSSLAVTLTRQNFASPFSIRIRQSSWLTVWIWPLLYHHAVWSRLPFIDTPTQRTIRERMLINTTLLRSTMGCDTCSVFNLPYFRTNHALRK